MKTYSFALVALVAIRMCSFSNSEGPDVRMASNSDRVGKVRPVFVGAAVEDGWVAWPKALYKVFKQKATWDEAEETCKSNGGHLASIESAEENDFVYGKQPIDMFKKLQVYEELAKTGEARNYSELLWLGGRQRDYPSSKTWSWSDGKTFNYTSWDEPEPNDKGGEQCIEMYNNLSPFDGGYSVPKRWNDLSCETKMNAFVCKK